MHGTITKTTRTDRAAIMRAAWAMWRLAKDVATRPLFDGAAIEVAARAAGASHAGAIDARNTEYRERRSVAGIRSFGDALRAAWAPVCRAAPSPLAGFAAERMAADCLPFEMEAARLARHADIDRREAAARAHANAH